jgi:hypothetical protein
MSHHVIDDSMGESGSATVLEARVNPEISGNVEVESAPVDINETLHKAQALVKWPSWVRHTNVGVIRNLQCFEMARKMCLEGHPNIEVARAIQSMGELLDDLAFAEKCVMHYRATIPKAEQLALRHTTISIENKLQKRIDVRADLEKLKTWMFERLELAVSREKSFGMLLPNTEKSFSVALEIVSKIQEIQEKEIGNPAEVRKQAESWTRTDFDQMYQTQGVNETLKNPVSRMKIARFLDQTMQLVGTMDETQRERVLEVAKKQVESEKE